MEERGLRNHETQDGTRNGSSRANPRSMTSDQAESAVWADLKRDSTVAFQPVTPVRGAYKDRKVSGRYRLLSAVGAVCLVDGRACVQRGQQATRNPDTPRRWKVAVPRGCVARNLARILFRVPPTCPPRRGRTRKYRSVRGNPRTRPASEHDSPLKRAYRAPQTLPRRGKRAANNSHVHRYPSPSSRSVRSQLRFNERLYTRARAQGSSVDESR